MKCPPTTRLPDLIEGYLAAATNITWSLYLSIVQSQVQLKINTTYLLVVVLHIHRIAPFA